MLSVHTAAYKQAVARLVEARAKAGFTQEQVAKAFGVDRSVISKIETCERRIDLAEFIALAIIVKMDPQRVIQELSQQLSHLYPGP